MRLIEHVFWVQIGKAVLLNELAKNFSLGCRQVYLIKFSQRILDAQPSMIILSVDGSI